MIKSTLLLSCLVVCGLAMAEETYVQTVKVPDGATLDEIVELSTRVVPHPRQMIWHKDEFIAFIHYGPNAFTGREWGSGVENPDVFNPSDLDTDQWCEVMKKAEIKRVVLTVKHHDGMCLWPSRYTKHSTASSTTWREGQGDVVKDLAESCHKYGLKFGIYLSPADLHQDRVTKIYGNESEITKRTIPRKVDGRSFEDSRTFSYELDDYNEYFMNQLFELLTEYGPIYEAWFDGAKPKSRGQKYNYAAWFEMIHTLAPNAMIAVKGPDTRWCGNEAGRTRSTEFNVLPLSGKKYEDETWGNRKRSDLASRTLLKYAKWLHYYPAEVNTSIRHGWFFRDDDHQGVRDADNVFDIYERAVGGNASFLLNIPPNCEGKFSPRDVESLLETGRRIRATYHVDLSEGAQGPKQVLDGNDDTYWQPEGLTGEFEIELKKKSKVNRLMLKESIATKGQRVEAHALDAWVEGAWKEVSAATSIGFKRIMRFPVVESSKFRVRITASRAAPTICHASAHYYDDPPNPIAILPSINNLITLEAGVATFTRNAGLSASESQRIYYTLDGSEPTASSTLYTKAFDLPKGGIIKARTIVGDRKGVVREKVVGYPAQNWKLLTCSGESNPDRPSAKCAFDGSTRSGWMSEEIEGEKHFAIDMQAQNRICGFSYLPPMSGKRGKVEQYRFEVSTDGKKWAVAAKGELGNIFNDPSKRVVRFEKPVSARYVKFVGVASARGSKQMGIQEIEVLGQ